jgi:hypothetical protein
MWPFTRKPVAGPEAGRIAALMAEVESLRVTIIHKDVTIKALDALVLSKDQRLAWMQGRLDAKYHRGARGRFAKRAP